MGIDETILFLEGKKKRCHPCDAAKYDTAINALRAKQEAEKNEPLTAADLAGMVGQWVWVTVRYRRGVCDGWAFIASPSSIGFLEQIIPISDCGKRFYAYRRPPEERG